MIEKSTGVSVILCRMHVYVCVECMYMYVLLSVGMCISVGIRRMYAYVCYVYVQSISICLCNMYAYVWIGYMYVCVHGMHVYV
jgi:hypothetical protein